ncbi:1-phosphofructokinase [Numidum massiliense]|uniref:1-phosphofructokinase n=1 Tax=Numidum massiliense TaxID=1522315 RepID=UPI0006D55E9B|nr:1-phosphofructokinase [Numidum massiliense]
MIYTCTLNAAIDLFVAMEALKPDIVNRTYEEDYQANGKGINVSVALKHLGVDSVALGFVGGFTGAYIKDELRRQGIATDFVDVAGITRVNIFVRADEEYKIVNRGPRISEDNVQAVLEKIKALPGGSTLVVSGSLPPGVDAHIFVEMAQIAARHQLKFVLDTSSKKVLDCLPFHPYVIKPNEEELAHFFDCDSRDMLSDEQIVRYGKELLQRGARQVIVSLGARGSMYFSPDCVLYVSSVPGEAVNSACAGDTLLATFLAKRSAGQTVETAMVYASAAGASTAFSKGVSDLTNLETLAQQVRVKHLSY